MSHSSLRQKPEREPMGGARKRRDLSKFIEDAVRWRIFNRSVLVIKSRNADADPDELQAGKADYLVTGDKSGLLVLACHKSARIMTARDFAGLFAADAL